MKTTIIIGLCMILCLAIVSANDSQASFGDTGDNQLYFGPSLTDNQVFFDQPGVVSTITGGTSFLLGGNVIAQPEITNINASLPPPPEQIVKVSWADVPVGWILLVFVGILFFIMIFKRKKG